MKELNEPNYEPHIRDLARAVQDFANQARVNNLLVVFNTLALDEDIRYEALAQAKTLLGLQG